MNRGHLRKGCAILFIIKADVSGAGIPLAPDRVFTDLFWITDQDFGLGVSDELLREEVTYPTQANVNTFSGVIKDLVDTPINVSIAGLSTSQGAPTGINATISDANGNISILYDAEACGFTGNFTFDDIGNRVCAPPPISLYHELVHAHRWVTGEHDEHQAAEETAAIWAENALRLDRNIPLRGLNSWSTPGGCGLADCGQATGGGISCFLVKATMQSRFVPEVQELRQQRDALAAGDSRFASLLLSFYPEYYSVGLPLIQCLGSDERLLETVRYSFVEPYLHLWRALFCLWQNNAGMAYDHLTRAVAFQANVETITGLAALADALEKSSPWALALVRSLQVGLSGFGSDDPTDPAAGGVVCENCRFPIFEWAVADALDIVLRARVAIARGIEGTDAVTDVIARVVMPELHAWAERCPHPAARTLVVAAFERSAW